MRAYIRQRSDVLEALWVVKNRTKGLGYGDLRKSLERHANLEGVEAPSPHDFRRAFALMMLRNGTDLVTLARLMGHTNLKVLQRYLRQLPEDLQNAHRRGNPVDNSRL